MKRRDFVKTIPLTALLPTGLAALTGSAQAATTETGSEGAGQAGGSSAASTSGTGGVPEFAKHQLLSDNQGLGPDGKPTGQKMTFTGASQAGVTAETASKNKKMTLTQEEQGILDGKEGEEKAKLMKILVKFGETFGAEKMVDLGGAPHSNLFVGAPYMGSMIDMLDQCTNAGLKSYATFTVNPRPYDVYNVQNNAQDMELIYQGYPLQARLDYVLSKLGAPDLNFRSCACYTKEVGNAPEPGTYVAWCESSAVNYGNSVLGIRTNRNGAGMDMICAMLGKAPLFGLMTDDGRKAKWLIDVKTSKEPDWGALGTAIGRKCVEDIPYIAGIDKYFEGGEITPENLHIMKAMGSATASSGAVGLYHVEGLTPEPKEKGRKMLAEGYQTYVYDDKEEQATIATFENLWPDKDADPTAAFIGCPHNTYHELVKWGKLVTEALDKAGQEETAIPVYMFCANPVRNRLIEEEGELASKMKRAGMHATNMCGTVYAGMKGFSDRVHGVTNSAKMRSYSTIRYYPDQILVNTILTGKIKA